jgi:hypothetical protein
MHEAIEHFNEVFGFQLDPGAAYTPEQIARMMEYARMRGRGDISRELAGAENPPPPLDDGKG